MIRTTLISAALTLGAMAAKAEVISLRIPCQYNGGKWTEVYYTNQSDGDFTLIWDDGPRMSYRWDKPGHGTFTFMVTDKLGGRWGVGYAGDRSKPGESNSGFVLTNYDNNNVIKCLGISRDEMLARSAGHHTSQPAGESIPELLILALLHHR